ncbi:MAG TPA: RNA 2',3'-cyclic phosphodiesterase [Solirubrobacteraceae bacterium]|nr:RNA 2',3'-cyclic phosphodiesterase [Solirubrobacteraceae bacterium]
MKRSPTIRLFAALALPRECTAALAAWARSELGAPGTRLLAPDAMHLTIAFLGERPAGELEELTAALEALDIEAPELHLGAPVRLPPRAPRTVAVEVTDPSGALAELQRRTADALASASGWEPRRRRFRPHITVARMRRNTPPPGAVGATPSLPFNPLALELLRSHLLPDGAVYELLATRSLHAAYERRDGPRSVRLDR